MKGDYEELQALKAAKNKPNSKPNKANFDSSLRATTSSQSEQLISELEIGLWRGSQSFQPNVFEFDLHTLVVDLQADGPLFQSSAFRVVSELRSEFAVDEELKVVSASNDADVVPLVRADVRQSERPSDGAGMWPAVLVDD